MATVEELWPAAGGPDDLPAIEQIPLGERGLPASTYELVARAAELWPDRPAVSVLADAEHWESPVTRTFAQLAGDVHRAAGGLANLGVGRGDAVAVLSVNCDELLSVLLAAEAVGTYAPINPGLSAEHATHLVRLARAGVMVASGPELDEQVWGLAREIATQTGARALLALRPTGASGPAPALEPLDGVEVAYLAERMATADASGLPGPLPTATDVASYLHTGGTTGTPKLAARTDANEVANAWMIACNDVLDSDDTVFAALPLFHTNALLVTVLAPLLRGPNVFAGYLGPDGKLDGAGKLRDGWLDTGDLASVDADGSIHLAGRAKDLIIRGGHNIDPQTIEDALLEHSDVTAAAAVGRPDPHAGEIPRAAAPKSVEIVDAIPLTAVGKPYKPELRRRAAEQAAREALTGTAVRDQVHALLVDGAIEIRVPHSANDEPVRNALSAYAWTWRLT